MKFTKFIPLVLALAIAGPTFAEASDNATSNMQITVPSFINITKTSSQETASATFNDTYTAITVAPQLNATFHVVTNVDTDKVYLHAEAKENSATKKTALGGAADAASLKIVFTKDDGTASSGAIANCLDGPVLATNANAIAFAITPVVTNDTDSGMSAKPTGVLSESGVVTYSFTKAGACDFAYTVATSAVENTFSTHDTAGTYTASLIMTHTAP